MIVLDEDVRGIFLTSEMVNKALRMLYDLATLAVPYAAARERLAGLVAGVGQEPGKKKKTWTRRPKLDVADGEEKPKKTGRFGPKPGWKERRAARLAAMGAAAPPIGGPYPETTEVVHTETTTEGHVELEKPKRKAWNAGMTQDQMDAARKAKKKAKKG